MYASHGSFHLIHELVFIFYRYIYIKNETKKKSYCSMYIYDEK